MTKEQLRLALSAWICTLQEIVQGTSHPITPLGLAKQYGKHTTKTEYLLATMDCFNWLKITDLINQSKQEITP